MRGNSHAPFGNRPTEKDPNQGHLAGGRVRSDHDNDARVDQHLAVEPARHPAGSGPAGSDRGGEVLADSAFGSGDGRPTAGGAPCDHQPEAVAPAGRGRFTLDDFTVVEPTSSHPCGQPGTVTCPTGHTRPMTANRIVTFGVTCRGCPLRPRRTASATGRSPRLHPHDAITRPPDAAPTTHSSGSLPPNTAHVERSIAWLVAGGNRRLRFRGTQAQRPVAPPPPRRAQPAPAAGPGPAPHRSYLGNRLTHAVLTIPPPR